MKQKLALVVMTWTIAISSTPAQQQGDRKIFTKSVVPLPQQRGFRVNAMKPADKNHKLDLHFALELRNPAELSSRVGAGELISPEEFNTKYAPAESDYAKLASWLKENGFEIFYTSSDHTSIYVRATVQQIEQALKVNMARVSVGGVTYDAATSAPSLPQSIGAHVLGINGLQPFVTAHKNSIKAPISPASRKELRVADIEATSETEVERGPASRSFAAPSGTPATGPAALAVSPAISYAPPYLVREILTAYNGMNLGVTGNGQKIAVLIDTAPSEDDLIDFWKRNQLSITPDHVETINVNQVELPSREGEETLDAEWTSGIAPGATVRIYASGSLEFTQLDLALDRIIADLASEPGLRQLSISLGLGESYVPADEIAIERQKFMTLASQGVNIFVSSGDAGSNPDETGHNTIPGPKQVEYQSSDVFTIGVGGTTLELDRGTGKVVSEEGWSASGGGVSQVFERPKWQHAKGIESGKTRLVPDVGLVADPSTGAMFVFQRKVEQIGGTSWSAPVWAGICALINEARVNSGKKPLTFLPPLIYPLAGTKAFRDITKGTNGAYNAQPGYDMVTGLGVPDIKALLQALTQ